MAKAASMMVIASAGVTTSAMAFLPVTLPSFPATWTSTLTDGQADKVVAASGRSQCSIRLSGIASSQRRRAALHMSKRPSSDADIDPRQQALDGVLHQIERCYGRGSILKMGDTAAMNVETTSTGVHSE